MAFDSQIIHWPTLDAFVAYLATVPRSRRLLLSDAENGIISTDMQVPPRDCNRREHGRNLIERFDMSSIPHASGIYQILCIPTGKIYIGSAVNLHRRWADHRSALRKGEHENQHLQRAWHKYGERAFEFMVLELVMFVEDLTRREQAWMDSTQCYSLDRGFNMCPTAGSMLGYRLPDVHKERIGMANAGTFEGFIDPLGNLIAPIRNLSAFCREHGLGRQAMCEVYQGTRVSYKGWTHVNHPRQPHGLSRVHCGFIDPLGNPVGPIHNLSAFCREHGLSQSHMQQVYVGKRPHHRGWTCERDDDGF